MHSPGAWPVKIMHLVLFACAHQVVLISYISNLTNYTHAKCTDFNIVHPTDKICTPRVNPDKKNRKTF